MDLAPVVESLLRRQDLSSETAAEVMGALMDGDVTEVQIAAFLIALRGKGTTAGELAAFAAAMKSRALLVTSDSKHLVDTCGTGGGIASFNISTAAAIVAAAAGAKVAKHGNRAMTSRCGSADVLEALGVRMVTDPSRLGQILDEIGLIFMFAPAHYPAMKHVGPVRKSLGLRTVFNQLGPLLNPADARSQIIGVYDPALGSAMAEAARLLGVERAWIVHGTDGIDEISPCAPTEIWDGDGKRVVEPEAFGVRSQPASVLAPGIDLAENAAILVEAISDIDSPRARAILPSAAAAAFLAGLEGSTLEAGERVLSVIRSGLALTKLEELIRASQL